ncbi:DUF2023 family protein [Desulfurispira natronophila]|uniref:DUF2023 domain-containing protein n=1 Tax=Desulfurispira natronophila TaxID=682562 RepID=A0A7W7Y5K1_9BACT|nr:DUF2023 family protein [Desulfurispira natronophila]MBB5022513.1 hypothetical protein [Desulfurispira natronophila]
MKVLSHHIYEYRKGLRNLILHTMKASQRHEAQMRLQRHGISYLVYELAPDKINIFFGAPECIEVLRRIGKNSLTDFTSEEDFILGTMLGYDRLQQCQRFLQRKRSDMAIADTANSPCRRWA